MTTTQPRSLEELDLPELDISDPSLTAEAFHTTMRQAAERSWLGRLPLGVVTLDREAGEHFLRCRTATFPGQLIAELYGVPDGPLREEIDLNILHQSGPDHARLRRLVGPSFTPRAADRWRPRMREFLADLWAPLDGSCEFVHAVAQRYPALTIAAVMGAPLEDAARLHHYSGMIQRQFDPPALVAGMAEIEQAVVEFVAYCTDLLEQRKAEPREDLISALMSARAEGEDPLTDRELVHLVLDVLIGGVDTTQAQLAHALRLFAEHPEQWEALRADPALVEPAVEEVLRHEPITPFTARVLTADVVFRDVLFPAGTVVMVGSVTGNRDHGGSQEFDVTADRSGARLLTFGAGPHHCLGLNLARAELQEALAFLAPRMPGLRLTGEPVHGTTQGIYGLDSLPVAWDR